MKHLDLMLSLQNNSSQLNISFDKTREFISKVFENVVIFSKATIFENIKSGEKIPLINFSPILRDKSNSSFNDDNNVILSDKSLNSKLLGGDIKINWNLLASTTWERYLPKGSYIEDVDGLREALMNYLVSGYGKSLQNLLLVGSVNNGDPIDGIITQIYSDNNVIQVTGNTITENNALDVLFAIYNAMPTAILNSASEPIMYVGTDVIKKAAIQDYNNNRLSFNIVIDEENGFILPKTNVRIQGFDALSNTNKIIAGSKQNIVIGCDVMNERNMIKGWYSEDNLEYRASFRFWCGITYVFSDMFVRYDIQNN